MTPTQEAPFMQRAMLVVGLMLIAGVLLPAANFAGSQGVSFSGHQILDAEGVSDWITIIWPLIVGVVMVVLSRWPVTPARVGVILGLTLVYPVTLGLSEYGFETNSLFPHAQAISNFPGWTVFFFLLGWTTLLTGALARHLRPEVCAAMPMILVGAVSLGVFWLVPHPNTRNFISALVHFWPLIVGITMIVLSRTARDPLRSGTILLLLLLYPLLISTQILPGLATLVEFLPKIPTASWLHPALFLLGTGGLITGGYALFCAPEKRLAMAASAIGAAALVAFWVTPISQFVSMPAAQAIGLFKTNSTLALWLSAIMVLQLLAALTGILTAGNVIPRLGGKLNLASLGLILSSLATLAAGAFFGMHDFLTQSLGMAGSTATTTLLSGALKEPLGLTAMMLGLPIALGNLFTGHHRNKNRSTVMLAIGALIVFSQILPVPSLTRFMEGLNPELTTSAPVLVSTWQLLGTLPTVGTGLLLFALAQFAVIGLCIANPALLNGGLSAGHSRLFRIAVPVGMSVVSLGFLIALIWPLSFTAGFLPATLLGMFKDLLWMSGILLAITLTGSNLLNDSDKASPTAWTATTTFSWCALVFAALINDGVPVFLPVICFFLHLASVQLWSSEIKSWLEPRGWPKNAFRIAAPFLLTVALVMCCLWPIMQTGGHPEKTIFLGFTHSLAIALLPLITFRWLQKYMDWKDRAWWVLATLAIIPAWQWLVAGSEWMGWFGLGPGIARGGLVLIFLTGLAWTIWWVDRKSHHYWTRDRIDTNDAGEVESSSSKYSITFILALLAGPLGLDRFYTGRWQLGLFKISGLLALAWWLICTGIADTWCTWRGDPPVIKTWFAQFQGMDFFSTDTIQFVIYRVQELPLHFWAAVGPAVSQVDASQVDTTWLAIAAAFLLSAVFCFADLILLAVGRYRDINGLPVRMQPVESEASSHQFATACTLSIVLGWVGADRFYTGRWRLGLLKLAWLGIGAVIAIGMWCVHPAEFNGWHEEFKLMMGFDLLFLGYLVDQVFVGVRFVFVEIPSLALGGNLACQFVMVAFIGAAVHWVVDLYQLFTGQYLDADGRPVQLPELEPERSPTRFTPVAWLAVILGFTGLHRFYTGRWKSGLLRLATFAIIPLTAWGVMKSYPYFLIDKLPPSDLQLMVLQQVNKANWLDDMPEDFTLPRGLNQSVTNITSGNQQIVITFTKKEGDIDVLHNVTPRLKPGVEASEIGRLLLKASMLQDRPNRSFATNSWLAGNHEWVYRLLENESQLSVAQSRLNGFLADTNNYGNWTNDFRRMRLFRNTFTNILSKDFPGKVERLNEGNETAEPPLSPELQAKAMFHGVIMNPNLWRNDEMWMDFWERAPPTPRGEPYLYRLSKLNRGTRAEISSVINEPASIRAADLLKLSREELLQLFRENDVPASRLTDITVIPVHYRMEHLDGLSNAEMNRLRSMTEGFWRDGENAAMIRDLARAGFNGGGWTEVYPSKLPALMGPVIDDAFSRSNHWVQLMLFGFIACGIFWATDLVLLCMGRLRDSLGRQVQLEPVSVLRSPLESMNQAVAQPSHRVWSPLNLDAWYYGRTKQKLKQSLNACAQYSALFGLIVLLLMLLMSGCDEIYELPDGGGEPELKQIVKQVIKIKEVPIVNPLSNLIRPVPPIEEILKDLLEETMHRYEVGQGEGKGAGFAGGTRRGKVRFIRLRYSGGDWDQDLDLNSDLNMLTWYAANTGHNTAKTPEVRTIGQLRNFPKGKSPPMVYMTGERSISVSQRDVETLREYLVDKHGMLFADNGGSSGWHSQFFNLMRRVLPNVTPRAIPIDHPVHANLKAVPIVAPHGGRTAYGWVVESRIVAYYHPGDVGDAWADGHAGVPANIWQASYRLGANIMIYSHSEYSKWLQAQKK